MVQVPEKQQQILIAHAGLIHRVVKACANRAHAPDLDQLLFQAEQNDWRALVRAIRRILRGERNLAAFQDIDDEDRVILESILRGIQNPETLPSMNGDYDPKVAAPGIASMVHTVRRGNVEALQVVSHGGADASGRRGHGAAGSYYASTDRRRAGSGQALRRIY